MSESFNYPCHLVAPGCSGSTFVGLITYASKIGYRLLFVNKECASRRFSCSRTRAAFDVSVAPCLSLATIAAESVVSLGIFFVSLWPGILSVPRIQSELALSAKTLPRAYAARSLAQCCPTLLHLARHSSFNSLHEAVTFCEAGSEPSAINRLYENFLRVTYEQGPFKGRSNQGLLLDMQNQLRERCLRNNQCRTGLYCEVHYAARRWQNTDYRSERCRALAIDTPRETLENQAVSLSGGALIRSYVLDANLDSTRTKLTSPERKLAARSGKEGFLP